MDEIKTVLSSYWTWLAVCTGFIGGVWWWKMTSTTANFSLGISVVALAIAVFRQPSIVSQPIAVRLLWVGAACAVLSLVLYYTLWTPPASKKVAATGDEVDNQTSASTQATPSESNQTKTLRDFYRIDTYSMMTLDSGLDFAPQGKTPFRVETRIYFDFAAKSEFVGYYIPNTALTYQICRQLADDVQRLLTTFHKEMKMELDTPGARGMDSADLHFTGRVFIYHEFPLLQSEIDSLVPFYKERNLSPIFYGEEYARSRNNALPQSNIHSVLSSPSSLPSVAPPDAKPARKQSRAAAERRRRKEEALKALDYRKP
jgi:hypothetical protein